MERILKTMSIKITKVGYTIRMFQKCSMSTILCAMNKCEKKKKFKILHTNIYCLVLEARVQGQMLQKSWQNTRKERRKIGMTDGIIFSYSFSSQNVELVSSNFRLFFLLRDQYSILSPQKYLLP